MGGSCHARSLLHTGGTLACATRWCSKEHTVQTAFTCPNTDAVLEFDLPSDDRALLALWPRPLKIHCPACEAVHETCYKDAYVHGIMASFNCLPLDIKRARLQ